MRALESSLSKMQIRCLLGCLLALVIIMANQQTLAIETSDQLILEQDTETSMVWPMLPNETLQDLAQKFYPNNPTMQRRFINKTKKLSHERQQAITETSQSNTLRAITIPNLSAIPASGGTIKRSTKPKVKKPLQLSYEMLSEEEKEKMAMQFLPAKIIKQYKDLVDRNQFLKDEIDKLKNRIVFLESKLGDLKLILDKTLTFPSKQPIKNLDKAAEVATIDQTKPETTKAKANTSKATKAAQPNAQADTTAESQSSPLAAFFNLNNKLLWLALLALTLLIILFVLGFKRYRERKYNSMVDLISVEEQKTTYQEKAAEEELDDLSMASTTINKQTIVEEQNDRSVLHEAKVFMKKDQVNDAIEHLKWAIRAKPKASITIWMFLLDIYRKNNEKEAFEKLAFEMHQNFNVMTPLWESREVAIVVSESLEDFPYIIQFLTEKWPNPKIITYLQKLITDNRSGERAGFSQSVIEEIVLLKDVLEIRHPDAANQETS